MHQRDNGRSGHRGSTHPSHPKRLQLPGTLAAALLLGLSACASAPDAKQAEAEDCVRTEAPLGSSIARKQACRKATAAEVAASQDALRNIQDNATRAPSAGRTPQ